MATDDPSVTLVHPVVPLEVLRRLDALEKEVEALRAQVRAHRPHLMSGAADLAARWALIARDLATADIKQLLAMLPSVSGAMQQGGVFFDSAMQTARQEHAEAGLRFPGEPLSRDE